MTPEALKQWRSKNNYTQKQLASALDVTTTTISDWERGKTPISRLTSLAIKSLRRKP